MSALTKQITFEEFRKDNPDVPHLEGNKYFYIEIVDAYATVSQDSELEFYRFDNFDQLTDEQEALLLAELTPSIDFLRENTFVEKEYRDGFREEDNIEPSAETGDKKFPLYQPIPIFIFCSLIVLAILLVIRYV